MAAKSHSQCKHFIVTKVVDLQRFQQLLTYLDIVSKIVSDEEDRELKDLLGESNNVFLIEVGRIDTVQHHIHMKW